MVDSGGSDWELRYTCSFERKGVLTLPAVLGYAAARLPVAS